MDIHELVLLQRAHFETGVTRPVGFRQDALKLLRDGIRRHEAKLEAALWTDLGKPVYESYMTEIGIVLEEIRRHLSRLPGWARPRLRPAPAVHFPAVCRIEPEPFGVALIMAPWNYPVQLCLLPLIGAVSAGCCAVIKPSAYAPTVSSALAELIGELFPPEYVAVVEGGREENSALLEEKFDRIFFTGSVAVGKVVMTAAAKHLTPVILELGGKSPVIVDETADVLTAARRVAFGKVVNAGQTCVAPDYVLVQESRLEMFLDGYRRALTEFFPYGDYSSMPRIINDKHFRRLEGLMQSGRIVQGGRTDAARRRIFPTVLVDVSPEDPVMQEEIFGPILPVLTYGSLGEAIDFVRARPRPLALYLFTKNEENRKRVFSGCSFGGGCVNDTLVHVSVGDMPFGGVGDSGMGCYHGKASYDAFTHERSVLVRGNRPDLRVRYHPYGDRKLTLVRTLLK